MMCMHVCVSFLILKNSPKVLFLLRNKRYRRVVFLPWHTALHSQCLFSNGTWHSLHHCNLRDWKEIISAAVNGERSCYRFVDKGAKNEERIGKKD